MKINNVCKIVSPVLFMITIMIVFPAPVESTSDEVKFYGFADIIKYDDNRNVVYTQTVHNQLVNSGEEFLLDAVFEDGSTDVADDVQIGSICVSDGGGTINPIVAETETATDFDGDNAIGEPNCLEDQTVTTSSGTAVIGPLTFIAGNHTGVGDTIRGIGICQNDTTDDTPFTGCATEGILFAVINTSNVTLASGETVDITYTFDISSAGS